MADGCELTEAYSPPPPPPLLCSGLHAGSERVCSCSGSGGPGFSVLLLSWNWFLLSLWTTGSSWNRFSLLLWFCLRLFSVTTEHLGQVTENGPDVQNLSVQNLSELFQAEEENVALWRRSFLRLSDPCDLEGGRSDPGSSSMKVSEIKVGFRKMMRWAGSRLKFCTEVLRTIQIFLTFWETELCFLRQLEETKTLDKVFSSEPKKLIHIPEMLLNSDR